MADEHCLKEKEWGRLEGVLNNLSEGLKRIEDCVGTHIVDADKPGGHRERLLLVEKAAIESQKQISAIKQGYWKACIVSGVIGGLLGKLSPDLFNLLIKLAYAAGGK